MPNVADSISRDHTGGLLWFTVPETKHSFRIITSSSANVALVPAHKGFKFAISRPFVLPVAHFGKPCQAIALDVSHSTPVGLESPENSITGIPVHNIMFALTILLQILHHIDRKPHIMPS